LGRTRRIRAKRVKADAVNDDPFTVKVNAFREIFRFNPSLKTQGEGDGHGQAPGEGDSQKRKAPQNPETQDSEVGQADRLNAEQELLAVQKAIEDFAREAKTQNHGLSASLGTPSQSAPGLTIVLSDVNGNVIRSFSGGEFLRLRQGGQKDVRGRGKLLDQKL
jgi:hypothetical protein